MLSSLAVHASGNIQCYSEEPLADSQLQRGITDTTASKSASDAVQCFVVATLASMTPAVPFIFRNYEYSPDSQPPRASAPPNDEASLYELGGSSKHLVWQAVRASSAAPYYLDDFVCGQDRYHFSTPKCRFQFKDVITTLEIQAQKRLGTVKTHSYIVQMF